MQLMEKLAKEMVEMRDAGCGNKERGWPGLGCVSKNVNLGRLGSQMKQYQRIKVSWRLLRWGNGAAKWSA